MTHFSSFSRFLLLSTSNARMSEGTFCRVEVHIWVWWPSWSCDQDIVNKISMPLPKEVSHKISTSLAKRIQRRNCGRRRMDGQTPDHGHPISSPCEPSARELKEKQINE